MVLLGTHVDDPAEQYIVSLVGDAVFGQHTVHQSLHQYNNGLSIVSWWFSLGTYVDDPAKQYIVSLVGDAVFGQHVVHHGDEDLVFLAKLHDQSGERVHRRVPQLRRSVHRSHQGVDDTRGEVGQVQAVSQLIYGLKRCPGGKMKGIVNRRTLKIFLAVIS